MARLIDAYKLLTKVVTVSNSIGQVAWSAVPAIDILTEPTVDAVSVVRCRECKHLMFSDCYGECGKGHMGIVRADDFCSRGERKEE